jgi:tetratricopeptide (TPR) repeat protein
LLLPAGLTATIALVAAALGLVGRFREGTETLGGGISVVALPVSISSTSGAEVEEVPGLDQLLARAIEIVPTISVREGDELLQPGRGWRSYPMQSLLTGARALQGSYLLTADITFGLEFPVTVDVFEVNSGRRVLHGLGGGGGESVSSAVQRLGLETVRTIAADREVALGSVGRLLMATQSPSALAELIEARQSFWVGETDAAIAGFQRAVDHDSTFAPAYFYLSAAFLTTPRWDPDAALGAIDSGLRYNDRMPVRWAALLAAQRLYILRDASAAIQAFHRLTADDPSFHEAWLGLGESHFHLSGYLGLGPRSSLPAFARLVDLDSTYFPSLVREHLVDAAIFAGRADAARQHAAQIPSTTERQARTATVAIKFGSTAERRAALASLSAGDLRTIAIAIYLTANQPSLMDMVAQTLVASGRPASDRRVGSRFRFAALAASSRWSEAIESWSAHDLPTEIDPWMIQAYLAGYDANEYVAPMFERASQLVEDTEPIDFFQPDALRTQGFRALVHRALMEGDSSSVTQLLEKLAGARFGSSNPEPEALRMSLHARQALLAADTLAAIAFLNLSLAHAPWSLTRYYSPLHDAGLQRILLVRLHAARGEHTEKQRWASTFGNTLAVSDVLYLAEALKALGMTAPSH